MFAQVIVDIAHSDVDRLFTYAIPENMQLAPGHHVLIPFGRGNKPIEGFVLSLSENPPEEGVRAKPVSRVIEPYPVLTQEQIELARWMQQSYHCVLVDALRLMIPAQLRGGRIQEKKLRLVRLADGIEPAAALASFQNKAGSVKAPRQLEVLELLLRMGSPMSVQDITGFLPESGGAIAALIKKGLITEDECVTFRRPGGSCAQKTSELELTQEQQAAIDAIDKGLQGDGGVYLLHGVTGSGKTEVYMHCINRCIEAGKQAILLVPEISLTPQTMGLFRARFGERVAVLHSRLSAGERFDEWRRIRLGLAQVAVGARSAVFAPFENLGLIVVDEEHEQSYQSELAPRYHAAEVARRRCAIAKAPLILGSATPSIQSYYRSKSGVYTLIELTQRVHQQPMPPIKIIDMREEFLRGNNGIFSMALHRSLQACLEAGKQAILFINRRGYSTFVSCRGCGHVFGCVNCDVSMTYHRTEERVKCHYCGHNEPVPTVCPACGRPFIKYFGVGTQQVEEQLHALFPHVKSLRMDLDSTRTKDAHEHLLSAFARGEAQVLIGTQMVAKGLDFPNVTLVGVVAADSTLYLPDYRSAERTFQLLTQVAGRAGRDEAAGSVVVQTYSPDHPSIKFARTHDYKGFFVYELAQRRAALFPPFSLFVRALFTGLEEIPLRADGERFAAGLEKAVLAALGEEHARELLILRASEAPIYKKQGVFRYQVLIKLLRTQHTAAALQAIYAYANEHRGERFATLEINPGDLF